MAKQFILFLFLLIIMQVSIMTEAKITNNEITEKIENVSCSPNTNYPIINNRLYLGRWYYGKIPCQSLNILKNFFSFQRIDISNEYYWTGIRTYLLAMLSLLTVIVILKNRFKGRRK